MFRKRKPKKKTNLDQQLQERCNAAWDAIKNHPRRTFFGIVPRPWILVLRTEQSEKSELLKNSELPLTSAFESTNVIDWWISSDAVFIDTSSDITDLHWETLLENINSHRFGRPIQKIMLVIDYLSLKSFSNEAIERLSKQLQDTQNLSTVIPISLVISQCDKLPGFNAMFDDLNTEQRQQVLGIHLSKKDRENGLTSSFHNSLSKLIERLKSQLILRLHREQSLEKRRQIFSFPNELSTIIDPIENLIKQLPFSENIPLTGIYFTSTNHLRPYFIHDTMKHIIERAKQPVPVTKAYSAERLLALPIAAAIIFSLTLIWHTGYNQTIRIINDVQENLAATPNNLPKKLPWLEQLNTLGNVIKTITDKEIIPYRWFGLLPAYQIKLTAINKYKNLLDSQFKHYIESTLLSQIQLGIKGNKLALFDALKTYLSLSQEEHYNKSTARSWYQIYWKALYPNNPTLQKQLQQHLEMLLKSDKPLWKPNNSVISNAREALKKLPLSDLAFLELQGDYESTNVPISDDHDLNGILLNNATIPEFFTTENAQDILNHKIPSVGKELAKGNWVLGTTKGKIISTEEQSALSKKIRKQYLDYYTNVWAQTISNIHIKPANSIDEINQRIDLLTNPKSKLILLLQIVINNTKMSESSINKSLEAINDYINEKGKYNSIVNTLQNLKKSLKMINSSDHGDKQSYLIAKSRFQGNTNPISAAFSEAENNPEPIRSWLNTIALSSWKVTLKQTREYLNTVWKSIVLPVYHDEIDNRYPVFKNSSDNISLNHFNEFFGPSGAVTAFFIYYLQDFVDTSKNYWTWKTMNGESLRIPQTTLNSFIRASIIQQMFFSDNKNQMSFKFILTPSNLSGNSKKFTLNVGSQILNMTQNSNTPKTFSWPGKDPGFVTIQFIQTDGSNPTKTYSGPWAWFRMLDANTLQSSPNPAKFTLSIQLGSNSASFTLIANHRINPMIPGIIEKFRCPEKL